MTRSRGFIRDAYVKHLRSAEGKIVSRYDATFAAADPFPSRRTRAAPIRCSTVSPAPMAARSRPMPATSSASRPR